jgi:hypothetical protein
VGASGVHVRAIGRNRLDVIAAFDVIGSSVGNR